MRGLSPVVASGGHFIAVHGPLTIAASLVAEHRLQKRRLSNCGSRAQLLHGMWDLPRPGLEPLSPALAGGFSTTAPPGKPSTFIFIKLHPDFRPPFHLVQRLENPESSLVIISSQTPDGQHGQRSLLCVSLSSSLTSEKICFQRPPL